MCQLQGFILLLREHSCKKLYPTRNAINSNEIIKKHIRKTIIDIMWVFKHEIKLRFS